MAVNSKKLAAIAAMLGSLVCSSVMAQTPPAAGAPTAKAENSKWSCDALVDDLLDYAPAKAVLEKHMPGMTTNDQIDMARGMTFRSLQQFSPDQLTDDLLAKIDADLAKLPPRAESATTAK